jgi:hypothetical protein
MAVLQQEETFQDGSDPRFYHDGKWNKRFSRSWPRTAVAEARGQFGYSEEGKRQPLEAVTSGLVKTQQTERT